jgi:predicted nucleotidyltransferase
MIPLIEENREKIAELCRTHHVKRLSVFGSAVRDDFDPERSDIDFLVEFDPALTSGRFDNYFSFSESLQVIFQRKIDLVSEKMIKNPYLRRAVDADKTLLYAC